MNESKGRWLSTRTDQQIPQELMQRSTIQSTQLRTANTTCLAGLSQVYSVCKSCQAFHCSQTYLMTSRQCWIGHLELGADNDCEGDRELQNYVILWPKTYRLQWFLCSVLYRCLMFFFFFCLGAKWKITTCTHGKAYVSRAQRPGTQQTT